MTYIKTSGPCIRLRRPACWDGKDGQLDSPAGDSGAQLLTELLLPTLEDHQRKLEKYC